MRKAFGMAVLCGFFMAGSHAAPYTPEPTEVVAEWQANQAGLKGNGGDTVESSVALANAYLSVAGQPGQARLYGLAEAVLNRWVQRPDANVDVLMAWARVQQHQHKFDLALAALQQVIGKQPHHIAANLLEARIHLVRDDTALARKSCLRLLGHSDLLTVSACSMEVASREGKLSESYRQLSQLINRHSLPSDPRGPWLVQMLADMAARLGKPDDADRWLRQSPQTKDVSFLAQWADVQLALHRPRKVLIQLGPIVMAAPAVDDALLLRLALAEQQLNMGNRWRAAASRRIALREQRGDTHHAADLALYYLEIDPQPERALHWARVNWGSAQEPKDKALLQKANAFAKQAGLDISQTRGE